MKSSELIKTLQKLDPSGDTEVVVGCADIYFAERLPNYYDGTPTIIIHDLDKKGRHYSVAGLRYLRSGEDKIKLQTMDLSDALLDDPELPVECESASQTAIVDKVRAETSDIDAKVKTSTLPKLVKTTLDLLEEATVEIVTLRARIDFRDEENEALRRQIAALARGNVR